jgi:hypothetical protein
VVSSQGLKRPGDTAVIFRGSDPVLVSAVEVAGQVLARRQPGGHGLVAEAPRPSIPATQLTSSGSSSDDPPLSARSSWSRNRPARSSPISSSRSSLSVPMTSPSPSPSPSGEALSGSSRASRPSRLSPESSWPAVIRQSSTVHRRSRRVAEVEDAFAAVAVLEDVFRFQPQRGLLGVDAVGAARSARDVDLALLPLRAAVLDTARHGRERELVRMTSPDGPSSGLRQTELGRQDGRGGGRHGRSCPPPRRGTGRPGELGRSRAKLPEPELGPRSRFADVAGIDEFMHEEFKREVTEIVDGGQPTVPEPACSRSSCAASGLTSPSWAAIGRLTRLVSQSAATRSRFPAEGRA